MGAEHRDAAFRNIRDVFDEHGTAGRQVADHMTVMDDLMEDVNRCSVHFECALGDFDRPRHPRAEAAGLGEQYIHRRGS
jgi:hypothetical protein